MGSSFNHHVSANAIPDRKEAMLWAEQYLDGLRHELGHGIYTGHLGTSGMPPSTPGRTCTTLNEAIEYAQEHHNKWDGPMLLQLLDGRWVLAGWCSE